MDAELKVKFSNQVKDQMSNIITACMVDFMEWTTEKEIDDEESCLIIGWVNGWVRDHIDPISKEDYDKEVKDKVICQK